MLENQEKNNLKEPVQLILIMFSKFFGKNNRGSEKNKDKDKGGYNKLRKIHVWENGKIIKTVVIGKPDETKTYK